MTGRSVEWAAVAGVLIGVMSFGVFGQEQGQKAERELPASGVVAPAGALPTAELPSEKLAEIKADFARFHAEPTREVFSKLEEHYALLKGTAAPAADSLVWLQWFYDQLEQPPKEDSDSWKKHYEKLDQWAAMFPESPVPLTAAASAHKTHGWSERGTGLAAAVSEAQWLLFHDHLERALQFIEKARAIKSHDAELYAVLIQIGMATGEDRQTIDGYVAAARKIDPRYYSVYDAMAFYLMPRWQGKPGDIGHFAAQMWAESPADEGPEIYARIASMVHPYEPEILISGEFDPEKLRQGARVLQARYPRSRYFQNFAGLVGWRTADVELARAARVSVDERFEKQMWHKDSFAQQYRKFCDDATPEGLRPRIIWSLHKYPLLVAFSPSGSSLVTGWQPPANLSSIQIHRTQDLSLTAEFGGFIPSGIAVNSAGDRVAVAYMANPRTGQAANVSIIPVGDWNNPLVIERPGVQSLEGGAFSPDGALVAAADQQQKGISIWNAATGQPERVIPVTKFFRRPIFSPDNQQIVAWHESTAEIFELKSGERTRELPLRPAADGAQFQSVAGFLQDGSLLVSGMDQSRSGTSLFAWRPGTNKRRDLILRAPGIHPVVSPQGAFVALRNSQRDPATNKRRCTIDVWSLAQRRKLIEVGGIVDTPHDLAFSADEKSLAGTFQDGSVRLWDLAEFLPAKK